MDHEFGALATEQLPAPVRTLWRVGVAVEAVVLLGVSIVIGIAVDSTGLLAVLAALSVVIAVVRWLMVDLRYRHWRWGLDDRWIESRSGVFVRTTQVVPRTRVQTLTTRTGPIDRRLGLSSIVVHTAGTHTPNLTIPHLDDATAGRLRAELAG